LIGFVSAVSFASTDSVEVLDGGVLNVAKAEKIQKIPMGHTRIRIERNEQQMISRIVIGQKAEITQSGVALEITDLLADLIEGEAMVDSPTVHLQQDFAGFNEIAASLAAGMRPQHSLGEVARFPGADGIYKRINVGGRIEAVKGLLIHIAMERVMVFPVVRAESCEPDLDEGKPPTLH